MHEYIDPKASQAFIASVGVRRARAAAAAVAQAATAMADGADVKAAVKAACRNFDVTLDEFKAAAKDGAK